ncbi:late control protein [Aquimarina sp. TRL1]|uniref:late control protein n=1 Tax=Aquimarina sp. (strain TRL1) TaxID=2736252 RepID=UPI001589F41A|nr:late control protein [Aquimarina sp. TRL1]QKX04888.1 late control protein [Aquimarina sp. TRL1]
MYVLASKIFIGDYIFTRINEVSIVKSVDLLSDTAVIKMPASAMFGNENTGFKKSRLENQIKAGDPVKIQLSYKGEYENTEFIGYVAFVKPNTPTVSIECEDAMYFLRKKRIHKNFGSTTLKTIISHIVSGTDIQLAGNIPTVNFDKFILKNVNGCKALQKITEEYGLAIYLNDQQQLYAGLRQEIASPKTVYFDLFKNVVSHDLRYRREEDVRLMVKVIGVNKDNTKIEVVVGDTDGEQRTLHKYNVSDKGILKRIGQSELKNLKYTGYEGSLTSFLIPYVTRGMSVSVWDSNFPERNGIYFVSKVTTTFGVNGARRKIELGRKLSYE